MDKFYVYAHVCTETKQRFYIGRGKGHRAYQNDGRSAEWNRIVKSMEVPYETHILHICTSSAEAMSLEAAEIKSSLERGEPLINKTVTKLGRRYKPEPQSKVIGVFVKQRRRQLGLTQAEFAKKFSVGLSQLRKVEQHGPNIQLKTIRKVLHVFGADVTVAVLL